MQLPPRHTFIGSLSPSEPAGLACFAGAAEGWLGVCGGSSALARAAAGVRVAFAAAATDGPDWKRLPGVARPPEVLPPDAVRGGAAPRPEGVGTMRLAAAAAARVLRAGVLRAAPGGLSSGLVGAEPAVELCTLLRAVADAAPVREMRARGVAVALLAPAAGVARVGRRTAALLVLPDGVLGSGEGRAGAMARRCVEWRAVVLHGEASRQARLLEAVLLSRRVGHVQLAALVPPPPPRTYRARLLICVLLHFSRTPVCTSSGIVRRVPACPASV
jgi:hypothetical protein